VGVDIVSNLDIRNAGRQTRRALLAGSAASIGLLAVSTSGARALGVSSAVSFIQTVAGEVEALVRSGLGETQLQGRFHDVLGRRAAVAQIARFCLGSPWRSLSSTKQRAYVAAFHDNIAITAVRQFKEVRQQAQSASLRVTNGIDAGRKGVLVKSKLSRPGAADIDVDWLVSDRGGSTRVTDIIVEGVSLVITQREKVSSMLSRNGNNVDRVISDLARGA